MGAEKLKIAYIVFVEDCKINVESEPDVGSTFYFPIDKEQREVLFEACRCRYGLIN